MLTTNGEARGPCWAEGPHTETQNYPCHYCKAAGTVRAEGQWAWCVLCNKDWVVVGQHIGPTTRGI